jgi:hypothetical protein
MVKRSVVLFFMCISCSLFGLEIPLGKKQTVDVKAKDVAYGPKKVILKGDVVIDHLLGHISCQEAELINQGLATNIKPVLPEFIVLDRDVKVVLKDGSMLLAHHATIDCKQLSAHFTAVEPGEVIYRTFVGEGDEKKSIETHCQAMRVVIAKDVQSGEYSIQDVHAEGTVSIQYELEAK